MLLLSFSLITCNSLYESTECAQLILEEVLRVDINVVYRVLCKVTDQWMFWANLNVLYLFSVI